MTVLCFYNVDDLFEKNGILIVTSVFCCSFTLLRKEKEYRTCATQGTQCSLITERLTARVLYYKPKRRRLHGKLSKRQTAYVMSKNA